MAGEIFVSEGFSFNDWKGSNTSWRLPLFADDEAGSEQSSLQVSIMEIGLVDMWMPFYAKPINSTLKVPMVEGGVR